MAKHTSDGPAVVLCVVLAWMLLCAAPTAAAEHCASYQPGVKEVFWGDLHVHTGYSLDAWGYGTQGTPREAYAFARGAPALLPGGHRVQLDRPLDFMAVTDHAEWFDLMHLCTDPHWLDSPHCEVLTTRNGAETGSEVFAAYVIPTITRAEPQPPALCAEQPERCAAGALTQWQRIQRQAHEAYEPCAFTTFAGYEWSATPDFSHTHRNVIFAGEQVSREAIDYLRYPSPQRLWQALDRQCRAEDGCDVVVIPHNTNMGDGKSFDVETEPADVRAQRARYERLVEIHQEKGSSECLPAFGQTDEDCRFEVLLTRNARPAEADSYSPEQWRRMRGSYVRHLLTRGLQSYAQTGMNPLQLGIIGSTDNHAGTGGFVEEDRWLGPAFGSGDLESAMARRGWNPGGLVAVWAEENTRASVFAALERREVYATSGPRIRVRVHAARQPLRCGEALPADAVPMGGSFARLDEAPHFLVQAQYDRTPLRAIELVSSTVVDGVAEERVVPLWQQADGGLDVCVAWQAPAFDPAAPALWYVRVLEAPTPRWSALSCRDAGRCDEFPEAKRSVRERAWTSPIWYLP